MPEQDRQRQFVAQISFSTREDPIAETSTDLRYVSGYLTAIDDAWRFWENRHRSWQEHFHRLHCVKIYELNIAPINPDGSKEPELGAMIFEWKCDWGHLEAYKANSLRRIRLALESGSRG